MDGTGGSSEAALAVVDEIKAAGGEAIANGASVTDEKGVQGPHRTIYGCLWARGHPYQ